VTNTLAGLSYYGVWSAMAVLTIAFIAFTLDLARRSTDAGAKVAARQASSQQAAEEHHAVAGQGGTATLQRTAAVAQKPPRRRYLRVAIGLTTLSWVLLLVSDVLRGLAAGRVPWANMFEFSLTAMTIIIGIFLLVLLKLDIAFLGAFVTGFALIALGVATVDFYVPVSPLPPALQSYWLVIHVLVAMLGTAFFTIGAFLSITQLVQVRREAAKTPGLRLMESLPTAEKLEDQAYRVIVVGFVLWTFTLMAGSIWAEHAWGSYWSWDTKEVWTFIIWVLFAGYIHARATRGWRGARSSWLAIIGFSAVVFNFTIVNLFFKGLHTYSGL
jgi:cytochrome c-type biogenesis protein CcsB